MASESSGVSEILQRYRGGDASAKDELVASLYDRLLQRAHYQLRDERAGHSLGTSDLANEALIRLLQADELKKASNTHEVFRAFARAMRQLLIDHARRRKASKRGAGATRVDLDDLEAEIVRISRTSALSLNGALDALREKHPKEAEALEMRYFGGYAMSEIAEAQGVSLSTIERASRFGLAWLREYLSR